VTKPATLLDVSGATISKVMLAYRNHGKTTSAKRNSGRTSTLTERDRHMCILRWILSKNHRNTVAQVIAELNTHLAKKLSDVRFTNPTSTVGLKLLNYCSDA
jgi:transposase